MRRDPFTFLRGTCHLFYADWPQTSPLNDAPVTWLCGDIHFENFGSYKGDNRQTYFDLNDFDEAVLAPCTWDVARFLTSVLVGAHTLHVRPTTALALCEAFVAAYTAALADGKARWVERDTARGMVKDLLEALQRRHRGVFLDSRTERRGRKRTLRLDGRRALPVTDTDRNKIEAFMTRDAATQPNSAFFRVLDVARRIAGTEPGSGALCHPGAAAVVRTRTLLDLKYAPTSALAPYVPCSQPAWPHEAARVVTIQRRIQAIAPRSSRPSPW
jgi:uncharacterized protein (DUF2252 family)